MISNYQDITFGDEDFRFITFAMATQHGRLREFPSESDTIKGYLERVSLYFTANAVDNGKKVAVLLSCIGAPTYALLSDLLVPDQPSTKSLAAITTALCSHYEPKRAVIAERFHLHKRDQAAGETAADFDVALHCKFEATLDDALRDRFVCGLRHESIQRCLLSEKELTYTKAMDIAQAMEAADRNTRAFKPQQTQPILHMRNYHSPTQRERKACYRCGRTNHNEENCKFKESTCHRCGKLGHIARAWQNHQTLGENREQTSVLTLCVRTTWK